MDLSHISKNYESLLKQVKGFRAIPLARFFEPFAISSGSGVYGIVFKVSASGLSSKNASTKTIHLLDPTTRSRSVKFTVKDHHGTILPGDLLKITEVSPSQKNKSILSPSKNQYIRHDSASTNANFVIDEQSMMSYSAFITDYNRIYTEKEALNAIYTDMDLKIFFLLETYSAIKILNPLSITQATQDFTSPEQIHKQRRNGNPYGYIDMLGLIVKRKFLDRSITLTLWDGSPCHLTSVEPVIENATSNNWANACCDKSNNRAEEYSRIYSDLLKDHLATVNIWNNDRPPDSDQYIAASQLNVDSFNIAILLNVEKEIILPIDGSSDTKSVSFTLRSGQHQGKALRLAQPFSVIGRLFFQILKERISDVIFYLDEMDPSYPRFDHELPCIRLNASQADISLQSDFSLLTNAQQCDQRAQEKENEKGEEEEEEEEEEEDPSHSSSGHERENNSPSPGPSNPSKRIRISSESSERSSLLELNTQDDEESLSICLPDRMTVPMTYSPSFLQSWVQSNLPPFLSFASLVSTSAIRLSMAPQLFKGCTMNRIDRQVHKNTPQSFEQVFNLARIFRSILEFDPKCGG